MERVFLVRAAAAARASSWGASTRACACSMPRLPRRPRCCAQFPDAAPGHTLFIVDPLGNLMMSYDARQNPRGLLEDLKKLLRLSHIG